MNVSSTSTVDGDAATSSNEVGKVESVLTKIEPQEASVFDLPQTTDAKSAKNETLADDKSVDNRSNTEKRT